MTFEPEARASWRLAKSLETLRGQVNAIAPERDKSSDGTIGDTSHASRKSDHNPNSAGVVQAMDISNDPAHGVIARALAEALVASRDPRIKYVISNKQINSSKVSPWKWRPYNGANAHQKHVHVSVMDDPALYDDPAPWKITAEQLSSGQVPPTPKPRQPKPTPAPAPAPAPAPVPTPLPDPVLALIGDQVERWAINRSPAIAKWKADIAAKQKELAELVAAGPQFGGAPSPTTTPPPPPWLPRPKPPPAPTPTPVNVQTGITATFFGGGGDFNKSAYDGHVISDDELGCSLPYHFPGARPQIAVRGPNGVTVTVPVVDVGPWNTNDPYWQHGARPQAESGTDMRGRRTNLAGIDLTPATARATGIAGKGKVDWWIVQPGENTMAQSPAVGSGLISIATNWKTTSLGIAAFLVTAGHLFNAAGTGDLMSAITDIKTLIGAISGLGLIFAKDSNVTGGTVQQPSK